LVNSRHDCVSKHCSLHRYPSDRRFEQKSDFAIFLQRPAKFSEGTGEQLQLTCMTAGQRRPKQEKQSNAKFNPQLGLKNMKAPRSFNRNCPLSLVRIATAGTFLAAAGAMAFVALKPSAPLVVAKSHGNGAPKLEAKFARSPAFARHLQTLLGRDKSSAEGPPLESFAQERYENSAYPNKFIAEPQRKAAADAAKAVSRQAPARAASWQELGPSGVPASSTVVFESTNGTAATVFSGRTTAIAVAPNCRPGKLHRIHWRCRWRRVEDDERSCD
jgi:hypothetical protein